MVPASRDVSLVTAEEPRPPDRSLGAGIADALTTLGPGDRVRVLDDDALQLHLDPDGAESPTGSPSSAAWTHGRSRDRSNFSGKAASGSPLAATESTSGPMLTLPGPATSNSPATDAVTGVVGPPGSNRGAALVQVDGVPGTPMTQAPIRSRTQGPRRPGAENDEAEGAMHEDLDLGRAAVQLEREGASHPAGQSSPKFKLGRASAYAITVGPGPFTSDRGSPNPVGGPSGPPTPSPGTVVHHSLLSSCFALLSSHFQVKPTHSLHATTDTGKLSRHAYYITRLGSSRAYLVYQDVTVALNWLRGAPKFEFHSYPRLVGSLVVVGKG